MAERQQERAELVALCRRHYESNTAMPLWDRLARLIEEDGQEIERLEQALEDLGEAHRLLAAQGLMAACASEGKDQ
jgi:hypothetical protein